MKHNCIKQFILALFVTFLTATMFAQESKKFSTAGFYVLPNAQRQVASMNPAWKFNKGTVVGAEKPDYDDSKWQVVSLPNGIEILPEEASGGVNYRGEVWYRKHFTLNNDYTQKRIVLYFEGIMGKSKVWVNGTLVREHFGGYLPISIDITNNVKFNNDNVIAVLADNSDDADYPPGKPQSALDFCYFGGIYRDCWLYTTSKLYITDANMVDKVGGGGLLVHYTNVSDATATVNVNANIKNEFDAKQNGTIEFEIQNQKGEKVASSKQKFSIKAGGDIMLKTSIDMKNPHLWSPDAPNLYNLNVRVCNAKGQTIDGYTTRIGIRSIKFDHKLGLVLNGKPFQRKLIGANRHQDFALIGNALSNSLHWRDAKKLKDAGMDIIRNAHYPQDPAFMDACAELGLFVIVNTPGWQFWNEKPIFEQRVFSDIKNMIRRDRNNPSIIMWEPILNETYYGAEFAQSVYDMVKEEFPYESNYSACDYGAKGIEAFDVIYTHPENCPGVDIKIDETKVYFTREFGDNVDDWNSHNSPSRAALNWGEAAQLVQANHYGNPYYPYTSIDALYRTQPYHIGGALWHSFDHQRGYHPDPFYGGIMNAFRRPKYSYYMFQSQSNKVEPMVFIANIMSPFSPRDVTVFSNCDEVRLHTNIGDSIRIYNRKPNNLMNQGMPSPVIVFEEAFDVMKDKELSRSKRQKDSYLFAEGIIDGKVVATHKVAPARRPSKMQLLIDTDGLQPRANGGDLVVVVAQITDEDGVVKRLNDSKIIFEIEGEGQLIGTEYPVSVLWGEAAAIVQTTTQSGKVKVKASAILEGDHTPKYAELEFETLPAEEQMIFNVNDNRAVTVAKTATKSLELEQKEREHIEKLLREVEKQQADFEGNTK